MTAFHPFLPLADKVCFDPKQTLNLSAGLPFSRWTFGSISRCSNGPKDKAADAAEERYGQDELSVLQPPVGRGVTV